jgi:hypothetical protein
MGRGVAFGKPEKLALAAQFEKVSREGREGGEVQAEDSFLLRNLRNLRATQTGN